MKKIKRALNILTITTLSFLAFVSCDKDFTSIGSDIIGGQNFEANSIKYPVVTYNQRIEPVQTNAMPNYLLGVYNDPTYGQSTASFLSQITPVIVNPTFGEDPEIQSVYLTVPFFSTRVSIDEDNNSEYELDSIFPRGEDHAPIKLSIYRSNYFLRDFDPDSQFEETQLYYSDELRAGGSIDPALLEGDLLFEFDDINPFIPSDEEIVITELDDDGEEVIVQRLSPRIRIPLDNDYWKQAIIDMEGETELSNAANFRDYFRGIYFKVESIASDGSMMQLDFSQAAGANITINYLFTPNTITDDTGDTTDEQSEATFVMNFLGNSINLFDNNFNFPLTDGDSVNGDENLYLKGGEGSIAVVDLFNGVIEEDGVEIPAFEHFEENFGIGEDNQKRLINEAHLIFYVNQSIVQGGEEPNRVYLYNLENKSVLVDYFFDATNNTTNPEFSRIVHSEPLQRVDDEPNGEGIRYKVRITEHLNNILVRDSTNVKLGFAVSGNINLESNFMQYDVQADEGELVDRLPISSLLSPRGTVLYGNATSDTDKRVELEIFYTEPDN